MSARPSRSGAEQAAVRRRLEAELARLAALRHAALLAEWARVDTGPLPSHDDARDDVEVELEVLCRALGPLAAVDPDDVFPRELWWE